jgi:hypothetical protein
MEADHLPALRPHGAAPRLCAGCAALLMLAPAPGRTDDVVGDGFGGMLGLSVSFGTIRRHLGVVAKGYYAGSRFQANVGAGLQYDFAAFGPPASGPEFRASLGGVYAWGGVDDVPNVFLNAVSNQTGRRNSVAYAYNLYRDRIGTSQPTGTFALQFNAFHLATENDFLAGDGDDKFRTGALAASFRNGDTMVGLSTMLWTGDTEGVPVVRDSPYPSKHGYKDMRDARYGDVSHGVLSVRAQYAWSGFQTVGVEAGLDSERVRHAVQNRLIHDTVFLPDGWIDADNPHVPMLDADGGQYLFAEGQTVEPAEPFFELSMNPSVFY